MVPKPTTTTSTTTTTTTTTTSTSSTTTLKMVSVPVTPKKSSKHDERGKHFKKNIFFNCFRFFYSCIFDLYFNRKRNKNLLVHTYTHTPTRNTDYLRNHAFNKVNNDILA